MAIHHDESSETFGLNAMSRRTFWQRFLVGVPIVGGALLTRNTVLAQEGSAHRDQYIVPQVIDLTTDLRLDHIVMRPMQAGIGQAGRFIWPAPVNGLVLLLLPVKGVTPNSLVFASVSEVKLDNGEKFIGSAKFTLHGVAPRGDSIVVVMINIEWGAPIGLSIDYMVAIP